MQSKTEVSQASSYDQIGGADGVDRLVSTFRGLLKTTEMGKPVHAVAFTWTWNGACPD